MNYIEALIIFSILFIIIFVVDYFVINKRKLKLLKNTGISKKGKKKKIKNISEIDYLIFKFKLNPKKINKEEIIIYISLINSFIIASVSSVIMFVPLNIMWQMLIAFALLFALIYALYEIYGRHLKRKEEKK